MYVWVYIKIMDSNKIRKKIIELTGEDPIDLFGETDWELYAEEFINEQNEETYANKYGR